MENREEKLRVKKGLWKPEEDLILKTYVETHGEGNWATVSARSGLKRGGKSCRLRWKNYLRPDIKRGGMSQEEEDLIIRMHKLLGNRWSLIAGRLPGRTDNEVKNYWNTHLNKRHQSGKRKATDHSNYSDEQKENSDKSEEGRKRLRPPSNSQPSPGSESLENPTEEVDEEEKGEKEEAILVGDTSIWEPQCWNYYIGSPIAPAINETFALDDGPFVAYLESFVLYESLNRIDEETNSNCIMQHSHMP